MSIRSSPHIVLAPSTALADEQIHVRVAGLEADQQVTVSAEMHDDEGNSLSRAMYAFGGTSRGNARASVDSWHQVTSFLEQHRQQ
jgi:hypothetical protein